MSEMTTRSKDYGYDSPELTWVYTSRIHGINSKPDPEAIYDHYCEWCEELGLEPADRRDYERVLNAPRWLGQVRTI